MEDQMTHAEAVSVIAELQDQVAQQAAVIEQMREALNTVRDQNATVEIRKAAALQPCPEVLNKVRADAFKAGFMVSGEGWNGEYPFGDLNKDPSEDKNFIACMNRYVEQGEA